MKYRLSLKKETKHTAVYETDDPLAPIRMAYVQKSWLAGQPSGSKQVVPPEVTIQVERVEEVEGVRR